MNLSMTGRLSSLSLLCFFCISAFLTLNGCASRSISDSGYKGGDYYQGYNATYQGELSDFDVLGVDSEAKVTDADIQKALDSRQAIKMRKGSPVLVIQSGAMIPDSPMVDALKAHYSVSIFSGVPERDPQPNYHNPNVEPEKKPSRAQYSKALRLAAARGGQEHIVVYWGTLETAQEDLATKSVSWVPFVGGVLPDELQQMRIQLKVVIIDVRSGQWNMFMPQPFMDKDISGEYSRGATDQKQVEKLKAKAYKAAADEIARRYQ